MPEDASEMGPANHHGFLVVLVKEYQDAFLLIAELALDPLIVLVTAVVVNEILASLAHEAIECSLFPLACIEQLASMAVDMHCVEA